MIKNIRIEVTNSCNLRCKMCPQSFFLKRKKTMIGDDLFQKIVIDLSKHIHGIPLSFHILGEPLLHKSMCDFVKITKENGFSPRLVTNATLLTEEMSIRLIDSGLSKICFSFEGINKKIYEEIRVGAIYEDVLRNIQFFLDFNSKQNKKVLTELVIVDIPTVPVSLINSFVNKMKNKFNIINRSAYVDWIGKIVENKNEISAGHRCYIMNSDINILSNGQIIPCGTDVDGEMAYGDFNTMTFSEIMESKSRIDLKSKIESGDFSGLPCTKCYIPSIGVRKLRNG